MKKKSTATKSSPNEYDSHSNEIDQTAREILLWGILAALICTLIVMAIP